MELDLLLSNIYSDMIRYIEQQERELHYIPWYNFIGQRRQYNKIRDTLISYSHFMKPFDCRNMIFQQVDFYKDGMVELYDLPGCLSQGDTLEEQIYNIKDAYTGLLESYNHDRIPVPWQKTILKSSEGHIVQTLFLVFKNGNFNSPNSHLDLLDIYMRKYSVHV